MGKINAQNADRVLTATKNGPEVVAMQNESASYYDVIMCAMHSRPHVMVVRVDGQTLSAATKFVDEEMTADLEVLGYTTRSMVRSGIEFGSRMKGKYVYALATKLNDKASPASFRADVHIGVNGLVISPRNLSSFLLPSRAFNDVAIQQRSSMSSSWLQQAPAWGYTSEAFR